MKNKNFTKCLLCVVFTLFLINISAQIATKLTVTDIEQSAIARKIENNASILLTELNQAFFENRPPSFSRINEMSENGKKSILAMWETTQFRCVQTEITERGFQTPFGFQVRNIPIFLKDMPDDEAYKEIAINFDKYGGIDDIYFTLDIHHYKAIMEGDYNEITDLRRRQAILNFVENFRTSYNRKDIDLLKKVFSDDALIITGKVIKQNMSVENVLGGYGFSQEKIEYQVQTKREYITKLSRIFNNNSKINVIFDDIEVVRHPQFDNFYGVELMQGWNTTNYSDEGFLFLLIEFKDDGTMQINVRTWQPDKLNGETLSEEERTKLSDFNIRGRK